MRQEVPLSQGDRRALYRCGSCFHIPNLMYLMNDYHVFKVHAALKLQSFLKGEKRSLYYCRYKNWLRGLHFSQLFTNCLQIQRDNAIIQENSLAEGLSTAF